MQTVIIVIHLMVVLALVGVVLLQRSDGGALGIGGGGGFMTGRGQANALTRATAILAALFFLTSLTLTILANINRAPKSIFEGVAPAGQNSAPAQPGQAPSAERQRQPPRPVAAARAAAPAEPAGSASASGCARTAAVALESRAEGRIFRPWRFGAGVRRCGRRRGRVLFCSPNRLEKDKSEIPWRGTSSSPAAWFPRLARVWLRRRSARCCRRAAIRSACASSTPISTSIPAR